MIRDRRAWRRGYAGCRKHGGSTRAFESCGSFTLRVDHEHLPWPWPSLLLSTSPPDMVAFTCDTQGCSLVISRWQAGMRWQARRMRWQARRVMTGRVHTVAPVPSTRSVGCCGDYVWSEMRDNMVYDVWGEMRDNMVYDVVTSGIGRRYPSKRTALMTDCTDDRLH